MASHVTGLILLRRRAHLPFPTVLLNDGGRFSGPGQVGNEGRESLKLNLKPRFPASPPSESAKTELQLGACPGRGPGPALAVPGP